MQNLARRKLLGGTETWWVECEPGWLGYSRCLLNMSYYMVMVQEDGPCCIWAVIQFCISRWFSSPSDLDTWDSVYMKCVSEDDDQLVHISKHRTGWQQGRNQEVLRGHKKGCIPEPLSQDSPNLRIFDNWTDNHHSKIGGQSSVLRQETLLIIIQGLSLWCSKIW